MWQAVEDGRTALLKEDLSGPPGGQLQEQAAEFLRLRSTVDSKMQMLREAAGGGRSAELAHTVAEVLKELKEMDSTRQMVQMQLRLELTGTTAGAGRHDWEQRLEEWKKDVAALRKELDSLKEASNRQSLGLSGANDASRSVEAQGLMRSTETLDRSSARLEEAKRLAFETESIGEGVLSDLSAQRETILHVRDNMRTVSAELSSARRVIDRMIMVAQRNNLITIVVATVVGLALTFWLLSVFGFSAQWTLLLAVVLMISGWAFQKWRASREG